MKTWIGSSRNLRNLFRPYLEHLSPSICLTALVLPLAGCLQESSFSPNEAVAAATEPASQQPPKATDSIAESPADTDTEEALAAADDQSMATAPAKKVSTEIQVPANLKPSPATAEIIKLANAGVEQSVMLSFVTNSLGTFNLRAEEIIYLNDIGVPSAVVTAMIQRDHLLQGTSSEVAVAPGEPEPAFAPPPGYVPDMTFDQTLPAPESSVEAPPMPAYASDNYGPPSEPEPAAADYSDYYDALAPYGNWVDIEGSGRCWQPTVVIGNHSWRPYFDCGRWVYTDCGWYWMSDYSWGWGPFHYGRWFQHATLGWCWRPDRVWGPAWVCWRHDRDYCGWAPLPPGARFVAGIGLTFHGHPVRHDFSFGLAANHFPFVPFSHFLDRNLSRHVVPHDRATHIFDHTTASTGIIAHNHTVLNNGIPRDQVAAATHMAIRPAVLHNVSPSDGIGIRERFEHNGRTLAVYRPDAQRRDSLRASSAPGSNRPTPAPSASSGVIPPQASGRSDLAHVQPPVTPNGGSPLQTPGRGEESRLRPGQPLILRGAPHGGQQAANTTGMRARTIVPLNSSVAVAQRADSRMAGTEPDDRPSWNSRGQPALSSNRNLRNPRTGLRDDDTGPTAIRQPQTALPPNWWATAPRAGSTQPQQLRTVNPEQFRYNRELPTRNGGNWNASVESSRHNYSMPGRTPEAARSAPMESHQPHFAPVESHVSHSAPVESHVSHSAPAVVEHSAPAVDHSSHSAPAPAPSQSSSSGRGR